MSVKIKALFILMVCAMTLTVFAACSSDTETESTESNDTTDNASNESDNSTESNDEPENTGEEQVEIRFMWWGNQDRHDRTLEVIEMYEADNPNVKIDYEFLGFDDYSEKLATQAAGGNAPDVFQMVDRWLPQYTQSEVLADLQPYIDSGAINTDNIDQTGLAPGYIGDQLVGLNTGSNAFALAYNPDMFDEAGVDYPAPGDTWEDYVAKGREVQEALDLKYAIRNDVQHDRGFGVWLRQNGGWLYNDEGTTRGWDDDKLFLDYINFWLDLEVDGLVPPADVLEATGAIEDYLLVSGDVPMQVIHSNQIVAVSNAANRDFELTTLPFGASGESGQYIRASLFFSMNTNTEHPDEVVKFMDYLTNSIEAHEVFQGDRGVPISSEIRDHLYDSAERTVQQQFEYIDLISEYAGSAPPPPPPTGQEMDRFFEVVIYEVLYGLKSPEEALEDYKKGVQDIIDRN
ncbi:ABC transporter substrate-binding protein [Evansella tamaricis]|uniref:Extracellular solute-binding protein n=1 Tax=Evansella tamaricis TaxID=2069301 RepID=A0ABS6JDH0_9BACI|nr:sugar ABC transporter substrate-binding protein [Evansella tamaricis]MBU9711626.1 extracellular solute-binding protein [Evansella tamaricis]